LNKVIRVTRPSLSAVLLIGVAFTRVAAAPVAARHSEPRVVARATPVLHVNGLLFKDLNKNGKLDPYEDWRLPVEVRAADLLKRMTLEEKAGLMMLANHAGFMGPNGELLSEPTPQATAQAATISPNLGDIPGISLDDRPSPRDLVLKLNVRWISVKYGGVEPDVAARWSNALQEIAEASRLGIPVALAADPMQTTHRKPGGMPMAPERATTSQWPDQIGFGAIADPAVVRRFGEIAAAEYRAMGVSVSINPIADVATEPRWNRIPGTFGSDPQLDAKLTYAYVQGFQGTRLSSTSVLCITKHFPGDGPVKDGLDPHNPYGKELVYPAKNMEAHLLPFRAAIAAGTGSIMGSYGIPVGIDTVGSNFSRKIMTDLLRTRLGFKGIAVTDWLRAMPWGVENLSQQEREHRLLDAGVDQLGGEHDPSYIINLVRNGSVPESRIDISAWRILLPLFELGLFENPYVDPNRAKKIVGNPQFVASGEEAQRKSIVLLKNANNLVPLKARTKLFAPHAEASAFDKYADVVSDPREADVLLLKVNAPFFAHKGGGNFFKETHEGTLAYAGSNNADDLKEIQALVATGKPVIVVMSMERPAVLSEFIDGIAVMIATFGTGDQALADIVFGKDKPVGKLPFDLPRDMGSVLHHKEDAAHDLEAPLFRFGFGLTYPRGDAGDRPSHLSLVSPKAIRTEK
jgi:beta-glucosidase